MNTGASNPNLLRRLLWPGLGAFALVAWTAYCHVTWSLRTGFIHGLLAFFAGLLVLVLGQALVRLIIGTAKRGWRWLGSREALRLGGWTILFAVSVVALFYAIELWRGKRAWANVVREAGVRGEPLAFKDIIPNPVPEQENFANAPIFAPVFEWGASAAAFRGDEGGNRLRIIESHGPPYEGWQDQPWPWLSQKKTDLHAYAEYYSGRKLPAFAEESEAAKIVQDALGPYAMQLDQVREFSARPYCRFPARYERQMMDPAWHLVALRDVILLLGRRVSAELVLRESDAAFADAQLGLRIVNYSRQLPWAASSRTRMRLGLLALQPVWEGLAAQAWTDQQLADLQKQIEELDVIADYPNQVRADALFMSAFVESLIPTTRSAQPIELEMGTEDQWVLKCVRLVYPVGWSLQDQAAIRKFQFRWTETPPGAGGKRQMSDEWKAQPLFASSDPFFPVFVLPKVLELVHNTMQDSLFAQTVVNQAALACALERYRLAKGKFPETLAALAPHYLDKLPTDLITGESLKYRRTDNDQFILYSVGFNRADDGGKPPPWEQDWQGYFRPMPDLDEGDWVWAYDSTPARP